jgi:hypothetical protein
MKKMLGLLIGMVVLMLYVENAMAYTLNWEPVTTYTDNTAIGPEAGGVFYNVEMDGTEASGNFSGASWVIPAVEKKSSHTFRARTVLGSGEVSAWTPPFAWTSPQGSPAVPSGMNVQQ